MKKTGRTLTWSTSGPSSLSDPNGLALCGTLSVAQTLVEQRLALPDRVALRRLEVREGIMTKPVDVVHDDRILWELPRRPCVDMPNLDGCERRTLQSRADLLDVLDDLRRRCANASIVRLSLCAAAI